MNIMLTITGLLNRCCNLGIALNLINAFPEYFELR